MAFIHARPKDSGRSPIRHDKRQTHQPNFPGRASYLADQHGQRSTRLPLSSSVLKSTRNLTCQSVPMPSIAR